MSPLLTPTGKSFRFVRACERARRGEAVWASERRFDRAARAVGEANGVRRVVLAKPCRLSTGCPRTTFERKAMKNNWFSNIFRGQPADNLVKLMVFQQFSRPTLQNQCKNNIFRGQPCKTNVKTTFFADNLVQTNVKTTFFADNLGKPMLFQ